MVAGLSQGDKCQAGGRHETRRQREREVRHTQGVGCATGGFPSSLGWEVRLSCLCVIAGLDWHGQGVELSL